MEPQKNRKALVIGTVWPEPKSSAAGTRMMQLLKILGEFGYEVTFASDAQDSPHMADLESAGIRKVKIRVNDSGFDRFVREFDPSLVLFDRFMTEEKFGWRVAEHAPDAVRILDTEDVHFLRAARQDAWKQGRKCTDDDHVTHPAAIREIASIMRSDLSLIISEAELHLLNQHFPFTAGRLFYLPFLFVDDEIEASKTNPTFEERRGFMTIGNFRHEPNRNAVEYLREEIWPLIRKKLPSAVLNVYGSYPTKQVMQWHRPEAGFYVGGRIGDAGAVFRQARVCIAPLRFGAGLKGKLFDAMMTGTPSVSTSIGIEGICDASRFPGLVSDDAETIAEKCVALHENPEVWKEKQQKANTLLRERFLYTSFIPGFKNRLFSLTENLTEERKQNFIGRMLHHQTMNSTRWLSKWIEEKNPGPAPGRNRNA